MAIDWATEPFSRLYKRETDDDLLLSWEARAVWHEFLKRCDSSGQLNTKRGVNGLSAMLRIPLDVVERVLQELIEDGRIRSVPNVGFVAPNYVSANYVARTPAARQAASRLGKRARSEGEQCELDSAASEYSESDDSSHDASHDVTDGHAESRNSQSDHTNHTNHTIGASDDAGASKSKRRSGIPDSWEPRPEERKLAQELNLDCDREAAEFKTFWQGDGRPKKDWHLTFRNRLLTVGKKPPPRQGNLLDRRQQQQAPRRVKEL